MRDIAVSLFGIFVIAFIIVFITGEVRVRKQDFKSVAIWMIGIIIAIPIIGFIVN